MTFVFQGLAERSSASQKWKTYQTVFFNQLIKRKLISNETKERCHGGEKTADRQLYVIALSKYDYKDKRQVDEWKVECRG